MNVFQLSELKFGRSSTVFIYTLTPTKMVSLCDYLHRYVQPLCINNGTQQQLINMVQGETYYSF